jgi:hypothetical protein
MKTLLTAVFAVMLSSACWGQSGYIVVDASSEVSDGFTAAVHTMGTKRQFKIVCLSQLRDCVGLVEGRHFPVQLLARSDKRSYPEIGIIKYSILVRGKYSDGVPFKTVYAVLGDVPVFMQRYMNGVE